MRSSSAVEVAAGMANKSGELVPAVSRVATPPTVRGITVRQVTATERGVEAGEVRVVAAAAGVRSEETFGQRSCSW
jgi:hypothetical protein